MTTASSSSHRPIAPSSRLPYGLPPGFPAVMARRLRSFAALLKLRDFAADAGLAAAVAAAMVAAGCCFDRLVDVPGIWRLPWTLLTAAVAAALVLRCLLRLLWPADYDRLAGALDRAAGDSRDHLRCVLDFARRRLPQASFAGISAARGEDFWRQRRVGPCIDRRPLRMAGLAVLLLAGLAAVSRIEAVRAGLLWQRFLDPLGNHMRPTATWLEVEPPPADGLEGGDDFTIRARLRGRPVADPVPLAGVTPDGQPTAVSRMRLRDSVWEAKLSDVQQSFDFVVSLGEARSAVHRVGVVPRPKIERITVGYKPPRYTGLPDREEPLVGRTITALEETKLRIELAANVPLAEATGRIGEDLLRFTIDPHDPRKAGCFVFLSTNGRMELALKATSGLDNPRELPLNLRVIPDAPPVVVVTNNPAERPLFPGDSIAFAFKANDDIGLAEVGLLAAGNGFAQEADLERIGVREAAGTITVPVAALIAPGASSAQVRLTALDGKGQRAAGPLLTLQIAANSYERQLQAARRGLDGRERAGRNREDLGFPSRERHARRLKALRTLQTKLTLLREFTGDSAGAGPATLVADARRLLVDIDPGFPYLVPAVTPGHGALRAIDVLGRMPMTTRLQRIVRDATCGAELAASSESLVAAFDAAVGAGDRAAAIESLQRELEPVIARQEMVVGRLDAFDRIVSLELAGLLATQLSRSDHDAADRDGIMTSMARLKTLAGLLAGPLAAAEDGGQPPLPPDHAAALAPLLSNADEATALAAAQPVLEAMLPAITAAAATMALDPAAQELPVGDFLTAAAGQPGSDWRDVYALWVDIQSDDNDVDEEVASAHGLALEKLMAGAAFVPPPSRPSADPEAGALRLACGLSRLADQAATLRTAMESGAAAASPTMLESSWLRLRELAFDLARQAAAGDPLPPEFLASLAPARGWLPPREPPAAVAALLASWERQARDLATAHEPAAIRRLIRLRDDQLSWQADVAAGIDAHLAAIDALVADLGASGKSDLVHERLPQLDAHLGAIVTATLDRLDLAEAARLHAADPGPEAVAELDRLVAVRVAIGRLRAHLRDRVGAVAVVSTLTAASGRDTTEQQRILAQGRIRACGEHRGLATQIRELCAPQVAADVEQRVLQSLVAGHVADKERKEIRLAIATATALPTAAATLLSLPGAEGNGTAAFWGEILARLADSRAAIRAGDAAAFAAARASLRTLLSGMTTPPREARGLFGWIEQPTDGLPPPEDGASESLDDLEAVINDIRPLARPPAVYPDDERLEQERQAAWRARFRLDDRPPTRAALAWAVTDVEWCRRKREAGVANVGIGGLQVGAEDELANLKLPKHIYLELKRAREGTMPELFRDRSHKYLSTILEKSR